MDVDLQSAYLYEKDRDSGQPVPPHLEEHPWMERHSRKRVDETPLGGLWAGNAASYAPSPIHPLALGSLEHPLASLVLVLVHRRSPAVPRTKSPSA